jgi:hypothetical protein
MVEEWPMFGLTIEGDGHWTGWSMDEEDRPKSHLQLVTTEKIPYHFPSPCVLRLLGSGNGIPWPHTTVSTPELNQYTRKRKV